LVDALHGLKPSDTEVLSLFRKHAISHQIILSKVDRVLFGKSRASVARMERNTPQLDAIVEQLKPLIQPGQGDGPEALGEIITCSAEKTMAGTKIGINNVRWAVLAATGLGGEKSKILPSEIQKDTGRSPSESVAKQEAISEHRVTAEAEFSVIRKQQSQDSNTEVTEERLIAPDFGTTNANFEQGRRRRRMPYS